MSTAQAEDGGDDDGLGNVFLAQMGSLIPINHATAYLRILSNPLLFESNAVPLESGKKAADKSAASL